MDINTGISTLIKKEPVVATHVGIFDHDSAELTYKRYRAETTTFVISPDIHRYQSEFIQKVLEQKTTIACLVAPFGYGKTSTAINIWNACEDKNIMTIPPFSCSSIAEMGSSIATGLIFRLKVLRKNEHAEQVNLMFNKYLTSSATKMAVQDAKRYDIGVDKALQSIEDKIKSGHLQLEASATHLLSFLEELVAISIDAGFNGLVIIVDEFQQFLGNINKGVITNFRTLIWGLQTRGALPLGFLITMDPDTERNLTDRGADILHRIKNNGLYLSFSSIYDREFPRELWSRYADSFGFMKDSSRIVDHATLEAVGQICERPDLSNGPRTVINIFQRIAAFQSGRSFPYSPINLIDDFLTGDIRFDGDRGKITSLVNEITSYDYIKRSIERIKTIKIIAAFPRGCPPEVADLYGLRDTYNYLRDELRGEILVDLPEGVALIDLQKVGKPQNKLNIILKKYWLQITEEEIISDKALHNFSKYGVLPLFPEYVSQNNGWRSETNEFLLTPHGGYFRIFNGTYFEGYPERRISVQICFDLKEIVFPDGFIDAQFIFLLKKSAEHEISQNQINQKTPTFVIPIYIHKPFDRQLPRDIREIETFLSPVVLSPGVLISLLEYINEQMPTIDGISEQETQRIQDIQKKLQDFLLSMSIGEQNFGPYGIKIYSRGAQAFRDALFNIFRNRFPNYQSVIHGSAWRKQLEQYKQALESISSSQRRGIEPVSDQKSKISLLFEQRQYAGFESYIKQFNGLVEVKDWRAESGTIVFHRHPQETCLIDLISLNKVQSEKEIYSFSRQQGYLDDETRYFIEFLLIRGYIEQDQESRDLRMVATYTQDELIHFARRLLEQLNFLGDFLDGRDFTDQVAILNSLFDSLNDVNKLQDIQVNLLQIQRFVQNQSKEMVVFLRESIQSRIEKLFVFKARFTEPLLESKTGIHLDAHINGAQRTLLKDISHAMIRIDRRIASIKEIQERSIDIDAQDFAALTGYALDVRKQFLSIDEEEVNFQNLLDICTVHRNWIQLIDRIHRLGDMTKAASEITDVDTIEKNVERIKWEIQQELASEGLKKYKSIYDRFIGQVTEIQNDLEALVRLSAAKASATDKSKAHSESGTTAQNVLGNNSPLGHLAFEETMEEVNLQELFSKSRKMENEFLHYLFDQNNKQKILIFLKRE